ncbi:hypothetical protein [Candidatus Hodgkinia cicadicola]|uniref:hypothetical protein n=1 Tax=Candidatus Hodgkinia cicadicola TaxID=573658 RepID=UPI0011BA4FA2
MGRVGFNSNKFSLDMALETNYERMERWKQIITTELIKPIRLSIEYGGNNIYMNNRILIGRFLTYIQWYI